MQEKYLIYIKKNIYIFYLLQAFLYTLSGMFLYVYYDSYFLIIISFCIFSIIFWYKNNPNIELHKDHLETKLYPFSRGNLVFYKEIKSVKIIKKICYIYYKQDGNNQILKFRAANYGIADINMLVSCAKNKKLK